MEYSIEREEVETAINNNALAPMLKPQHRLHVRGTVSCVRICAQIQCFNLPHSARISVPVHNLQPKHTSADELRHRYRNAQLQQRARLPSIFRPGCRSPTRRDMRLLSKHSCSCQPETPVRTLPVSLLHACTRILQYIYPLRFRNPNRWGPTTTKHVGRVLVGCRCRCCCDW